MATLIVNEGVVTPDDTLGRFFDPPGGPSIYTDYIIRTHYEKDRHTYQAGITSPNGFAGQSVAFFRLATPTLLCIVDWSAARTGFPPEPPDPSKLADANWILLDDWYEAGEIQMGADGITPSYRISGTYTYGHKNPAAVTINNVTFGLPPYIDGSQIVRTVSPGNLKGNIIDSGSATSESIRPPSGNVTQR